MIDATGLQRIVWLGPIQPEGRMPRSAAASPAAVRWSEGFVGGLDANGVSCRMVGHEPTRAWPWGPLRPRPHAARDGGRTSGLAYTNVPGIRGPSLDKAYAAAVRRQIDEFAPDLVVTYNAEPFHAGAVAAAAGAGVPWIPIVLDAPDPDASWGNIADLVRGACGVVFLSHWASVNCPWPGSLHLDGGIVPQPAADATDPVAPVVLYTGAKGPWAGLDLLLDAWREVRRSDARLWVCGQGRHDRLRTMAAADARITDFGMVEETRLRQLRDQATVLVNPRSPSYPGNLMNFPSKLLDYLGTGKPVVTTRTAGLAPEYDRVLVFAEPAEPASLAAAIDAVLQWTPEQRAAHRRHVERFAAEHGDWRRAAAAFLSWASRRLEGAAPPRAGAVVSKIAGQS
jgi:glycosyltransferase involved in cell wall biosynthesis